MTHARFALTLLVALAAGCSILPKPEPQRIYTLPAAPGARPMADSAAALPPLRIATPNAPRALDSNRIAVVPEANTLTVYAGARWSDAATHVFRDRLADAFRDSGRAPALSTDDGNIAANIELGGTLSAFQTEYVSGRPEVVIRFDAVLVHTRRHDIAASRRFEVREPVHGKDVPQVVEAFGRAMNTLSSQAVSWVLSTSPL